MEKVKIPDSMMSWECFQMQDMQEKIEQTVHLMLMLWALFMIALYTCSFLAEYHFPGVREEMLPGDEMLGDLQKGFFFSKITYN